MHMTNIISVSDSFDFRQVENSCLPDGDRSSQVIRPSVLEDVYSTIESAVVRDNKLTNLERTI